MRLNKYRNNEDIKKLHSEATDYTYKCKCGCSTVIYPYEHIDRKICRHCGYYVYTDTEKQKQYNFMKEIKKRLGNGNN